MTSRLTPVLKAAVVVVAATTATLAFRPRSLVVLWPLLEDGFYSLTVARNVALGRGVSFDGVSPTNGFQPLFTFLSVPAFLLAGADRYRAVRLVLGLHWAFYLGTAAVLGLVARRLFGESRPGTHAIAFWAAAFLYLANPLAFQAHFNGLETGCALFFYAVVWLYGQSRAIDTPRALVVLGGLLGLTVLARVDAVFFVGAVCAYLLLSPAAAFARPGDRLRPPLLVGAVAFLVSSPWWLYNSITFGSLMPSSGAAQQDWGLEPARMGLALLTLARMVTPWWVGFDPGRFGRDPWADAARVGLLVLGLGLLWWRRGDVRAWLAPRAAGPARPRPWPGLCLLVASLGLLLWYAASSFASWFYARYLSPLLLIGTLALAWLLVVLADRRPLAALVFVAVTGWSVPWDALASYRGRVEKGNIMYTNQLPMVEARVPDGECVAALQSGTLGYFRDCVVNLDGKVNPAVLTRRRDIWRYLDERKVRWLCDWPQLFRSYFGSRPEQNGWEAVHTWNKFVLYRRKLPEGSAPDGAR
jgi:hypothetical protein